MKKKNLQKVLATALVGAMAVGTLTGCGGDEGGEGGSTTEPGGEDETQNTRTVTVMVEDADGNPVANVGISLWVNPQGGQEHYDLLEYLKLTDANGTAAFEEAVLKDLPANVILYTVIIQKKKYPF